MNLTDIKNINQNIYKLDTEINRNQKLVFLSALVFCSLNSDFRNPSKMTTVINFATSDNPMTDLVELAKSEIGKLKINKKTFDAVCDSLDIITGVNTKLYKNRSELQSFVFDFVNNKMPLISGENSLFFETIYMEVDKKAKNNDTGITLTPFFASKLMIELADLNYKNDVVADLCSGTGLFSMVAFAEMERQLENDKANISQEDYLYYKDRLAKSIVANDFDAKMVTLTLANFILKNLNTNLLFKFDIFEMKKSDFAYLEDEQTTVVLPTKAILNPPYEDNYKPTEIVLKNIELVKGNVENGGKVIVIIPPQKFGQKKDVLFRILNLARLDSVIKMQNDLFSDSGQSPATSIFVFDTSREHRNTDEIRYFDFTDSGFVFLKDSGMVDKNSTHQKKKDNLISRVRSNEPFVSSFIRNWGNFFEISGDKELIGKINPNLVKVNAEEADITYENVTIKKMLKEKKELIDKESGLHEDDGTLENYFISILSEE